MWTNSIFNQLFKKVQNNIARLYEQGASIEHIGQYWHKWLIWVKSGLSDHSRALKFNVIGCVHRGTLIPVVHVLLE